MTTVTRLLVHRQHIATTEIETLPAEPLQPGQARLRIDRFALTANNITYAATGEMLKYWDFFPAPAPWGVVPVWGFATVTETQSDAVAVGEQVWGFLPMASHCVVQPARATAHGFTDGAEHRRALPKIYNDMTRCAHDPLHRDGQEDAEALLRPMFSTSWLVDDFLADNACFDATTVVVSSASSKTAYGTAFQLHQRPSVEVVGLTAPGNKAFVEGLGCYHRVLGYDEVEQLSADTPSVYLDYAGSVDLRRRVHERLLALRYSCSIGASHVTDLGPAGVLPGPKPVFFFAPSQAAKRAGEWGGAVLMQRMAQDWQRFLERLQQPANPWLQVQRHSGPTALRELYAQLLQGGSPPLHGHMVTLSPGV